ncbi:6974_t:CDS:2 [Acaulospora morrowiae]|uniref:6974_t:CDS:1 n=1 Tax=Acaulospora morrowiae TaxID=94023 RepID=A0A9N9H7W6_9GLOM|nr:6974_t:CDS:2 [Acaulospora morrowiae]
MSASKKSVIAAPDVPYYTPYQDPPVGLALTDDSQTESLPPLFQPLTIRGVTFNNRIALSPMCMYSSKDGLLSDWHLVHLGQFALRGVGLIFVEATAVTPEGRISPQDSGLWNDDQILPLKKIVDLVHSQGVKIGIQLAHAGRKASTISPFHALKEKAVSHMLLTEEDDGWPNDVVAPSPIPWDEHHADPKELTISQILEIQDAFVAATKRALKAGFDVVELHYAHGYLVHEFLSSITNHRNDEYGGSLENRIRLAIELAKKVREVWPEDKPLFARVSASDWVENDEKAWDIKQTIELSKHLKSAGVDLVDTSSAGNTPMQKIKMGFGYQVSFAEAIRREVGILTGAVGAIIEPEQANKIIESKQADIVLVAKAFLQDGSWVFKAAKALGAEIQAPQQYYYAIKRLENFLKHNQRS